MEVRQAGAVGRAAAGRVRQLGRLGLGLRSYLATPLDIAAARRDVERRLAERERIFVDVLGRLVYAVPASPYARLLRRAGCERADVQASVRAHGVEGTLERLRDAGVYVTYAELRGRAPIVRDGLELPPRVDAFDNPRLPGGAIGARTSGTSAAPRPVLVSWHGLAEEAADNLLLYEAHGLLESPLAVWLPPPPGIGGINFVLVNAKRGRPPERWFTPVETLAGAPLGSRLLARALPLVGRSARVAVPRPERVPYGDAAVIARWLVATGTAGTPAIVRTSASAAVRVADAARRGGIDVEGAVAVAGGEPLTPPRRRAIEAAGMRVVPNYGASEFGGIFAGGCPAGEESDDMHVYLDRAAVVPRRCDLGPGRRAVDALLVTSLSTYGGQVLLNAELGDHGDVLRRRCGCAFDALGMDVHVSRVRSHEKLTAAGMALLGDELDEAVAACVERAGGGPGDYQFWERVDELQSTRLVLAVAPQLELDEARFLECVRARVRARGRAGAMVDEVWGSADTLELVRERPRTTDALKTPAVVRERR